jgi:Tol biopolymer transport system component
MPRRLIAFVPWLIISVSCSSSGGDVSTGSLPPLVESPALGASPSPRSFSPGVVAHDRLLVTRDDGSLVTMSADGSEVLTLARGESEGHQARQAVWSPDGRGVAWVEVNAARPGPGSVIVSDPEGQRFSTVEVGAGVFFLQWDPTSSRVAYLGNITGSIGMGVVDLRPEVPVDLQLGAGNPFYLSWSPDGNRMVVHVGQRLIGILEIEGELERFRDRPAPFQAPIWLPEGGFVFAAQRHDEPSLVVREGQDSKRIASFGGQVSLVASPNGRRLAYSSLGEGADTDVYVVDLRTGDRVRVLNGEAATFFWSPDSRALLVMTPVESDLPGTHRWMVWDGRVRFSGETFLPSPSFLQEYVPFFSQYAQAMSLWSPDASAFAYAGLHDGRAGIWVQPADGGEPTLVSDGELVAWSPT